MSILDHTQDLAGTELHRLTNVYPPPAFVKSASAEQLYGPQNGELPNHVFAEPCQRNYPCHSKAATWLSCLFFLDKQASLSAEQAATIRTRIWKQGEFFGITGELEQLRQKMAADADNDLARLPDEQFAMVWNSATGKERHYPLRNPEEIKMAADWFVQYRQHFAFPDRHVMARKILNRATDLAVPLEHDELLQKTAGYGYCAGKTAAELLEKRAGMVAKSDPTAAAALRDVASAARTTAMGMHDTDLRIKLAALVDQFDRCMHLDRFYGDGGLEYPEEGLFQITEKVAKAFLAQHVSLTDGAVYEKEALASLSLDHIRSWLGDEFAQAVTGADMFVDMEKLAALASSLPRTDAVQFNRMADAAGITIAARDNAPSVRLTVADLTELAATYQPQ
jgi:hypothetical protein